jgi:hypothetical protein
MLPQPAFLFNTSGGSGSGIYQVDISFSTSSKAQFLAPGDRVTDVSGNAYLVDSPSGWVGFPADFSNAGTVNVVPVTTDISPANSLALGDATVETPGQIDVDAQVQTAGTISSSALIEGRTYTYQVSAGWAIGSEANKAIVGDRIIDNAGKVFEIVALSGQPGAFAFPFNVVEADKVGDAPNTSNAYLYRGTPNFDFYQGEFVAQLTEDTVRNRDEFITDLNLLASTVATRGFAGTSGTITSSDSIIVVTNSGAVTLTIQGTFVDGKLIYIKDGVDSGFLRPTNPITIDGGGATIDGVASVQLTNPGESFTLAHNSGTWHLV